jgi:hypothetical protein
MKACPACRGGGFMIVSNTITVAHAEVLLKATPSDRLIDVKLADREKKTVSIEQLEKLEKDMSQVQEKYQKAEPNYGSDLLNLVVANGYISPSCWPTRPSPS